MGNWADNLWDYNGDADYLDVGAADTDRNYNSITFTSANEVGSLVVDWGDGDATPTQLTYTMIYDGAGNLTDDSWNYEYVYDAWNRLRKVNNQSVALVAEFTYNGLGHRVEWHYDIDDCERRRPDRLRQCCARDGSRILSVWGVEGFPACWGHTVTCDSQGMRDVIESGQQLVSEG